MIRWKKMDRKLIVRDWNHNSPTWPKSFSRTPIVGNAITVWPIYVAAIYLVFIFLLQRISFISGKWNWSGLLQNKLWWWFGCNIESCLWLHPSIEANFLWLRSSIFIGQVDVYRGYPCSFNPSTLPSDLACAKWWRVHLRKPLMTSLPHFPLGSGLKCNCHQIGILVVQSALKLTMIWLL